MMSTPDCCKDGHDFQVAKANYYKLDSGTGNGFFGNIYNQSVVYSTLYCKKCGETKEVISADHRKDGHRA